MKIVGEVPHPRLKITLLRHGRYFLKVEDGDVELTYRFRDGEGVTDLDGARRLLDLGLLQEAERALRAMAADRARFLKAASPKTPRLPDII